MLIGTMVRRRNARSRLWASSTAVCEGCEIGTGLDGVGVGSCSDFGARRELNATAGERKVTEEFALTPRSAHHCCSMSMARASLNAIARLASRR